MRYPDDGLAASTITSKRLQLQQHNSIDISQHHQFFIIIKMGEEAKPTATPSAPVAAVATEEIKPEIPGPNDPTKPILTNADIAQAETAAQVADTAEKLDTEVSKLTIDDSKSKDAPVETAATPTAEKQVVTPQGTPLSRLFAELPSIISEAGHFEIWGVELTEESHVPSTIVLEKFLRANTKDVAKAKAQLIEALKWRKAMQPAKLLADTNFDPAKFGGVGYVTTYGKEIVTWNIYGAVKDNKATFGNVEE